MRCIHFLAAITTSLLFGSLSISAPGPDGYMDNAELDDALRYLADHNDSCQLSVIGESGRGRDIRMLTLSSNPDTAESKPAILIVAGLDGRHWVGTETAVRVAGQLLEDHNDLLDDITFYIIARVNPDGTAVNFGEVNVGHIGTLTDVDADRDAMMNENGPSDLNGDGLITQMRRLNPPLDDTAIFIADPAELRLLKKPDADKGETAMYSVYIEGLDSDGDGKIAEDGDGFVDLDHNFMHEWPAFARDGGTYPLSEPEAKVLAMFVLEHDNIAAAMTYGRHDNLVNMPDTKGRDVAGRGPKVIDSGDASLYKEIGKIFKEVTEQKRAPKEDVAGSFHAWLYAQRGIASFASVIWGRPDPTEPESEDDEAGDEEEAEGNGADSGDGEGDAGADPVSGIWSSSIAVPEMGDMELTFDLELLPDDSVTGSVDMMMGTATITGTYATGSGELALSAEFSPEVVIPMSLIVEGDEFSGTVISPDGDVIDLTGKRISGDDSTDDSDGEEKNGDTSKPANENAAQWLKYSDIDRDGEGFVEWTEFEHPTLGMVEIGGFVPGFRMNPPADELDDLAEKQTAFIVKLTEKLPRLRHEGPTVKKLASGLYEIRFAVVNDGYMPTKTAMARKARTVKPTIVRLLVPVENIVAGHRVDRIWGLNGSGGRSVHHWIVTVDDDSQLTIEVLNAQFGDRHITFMAK